MSKEPKKYTKGFTDIEMIGEVLSDREKADRRAEWLKLHANPSKDGKPGDLNGQDKP